jgi:hypothetical protein
VEAGKTLSHRPLTHTCAASKSRSRFSKCCRGDFFCLCLDWSQPQHSRWPGQPGHCTIVPISVLRSGSVRFFAPKTCNRGPQPVQDRPRYWGDRTGPPRTSLLRSTQPKKTSSDRFFGVIFVVPIEIIFISTIITLKIKRNI